MPKDLRAFLDSRLVSIAGAAITPASLILGAIVVFATLALANLLAFSAGRLVRSRGGSDGSVFAVAKMVRYAGTALGLIVGVNMMGVRLDALIAASTVLAVGIGFGLQNIAQNFISGLILLIEQPVRHGDFVRVGDVLGTVEDIGLRATVVVTRDAVTIIVPNSELVTSQVVNHSRPTTSLRIRVTVGVAYGTEPSRVSAALLDVARGHPDVMASPPPDVRFEDFGDSALSFALLCWIRQARDDIAVMSALRFAIEKRFRADGIEIPFPQRDVRVKLSP